MEKTERLQLLKKLLKVERDEDFEQYKHHFSRNNINHRRENGVTWYPVVITNVEIGLGEYLSIDIERTTNHNEPHQFSGGKTASLFSNNHTDASPVNGTIKVLGRNKIRLSLNIDELPDWCDDGKLGINLLFDERSYKEMDIAMEKVITASHSRLAHLRDVMYELKIPVFDKTDESLHITGLNQSQNKAVQKIIAARDIAIIHGPPGTGKTTTLVQAIRLTLKTEKQVLVCSSSNTAVDLLTEKLHRTGINVLRLGNPARISEDVISNTLDAKVAAHDSYKDLKSYRKTAEEYFRMAGKYKRTFGKEEREQRQLFYQEARKILQEARVLEDYIISEQFDKAQVIACTPVVSAGRMMRDKQFTTVFIDEAAQALEPMCWIPISRSNRVIFAGDHFQLPPTVKSKKAENEGLKETLFENCMHIENISVMLNTQYRMNEHIMNFSNQKFYQNNLVADTSVKDTVLSFDPIETLLNTAFDFIDTAGCGYTEIVNPESLSIANPEEGQLLLKHLKLVLEQYEQSNKSGKKISIGIISPYKEQVQYLTTQITADEEMKNYLSQIAVKTVDGFQGQERDIIYISLVRSNDLREIGFLNDIRRMNVALTRAKKKLVVIGDSATLGNHPFYKSFLEYADSVGAYKTAWEFIGYE
ncbi:MAG: DNA-binding protein [Bacteroidetes bacterium RIFCSPLOWO2_12_FULL_35_15]|nr:MAG: DNA-binding protein [Bacteroidetes bacterium RIFCSPLOWO2_12_FULL_35_15]